MFRLVWNLIDYHSIVSPVVHIWGFTGWNWVRQFLLSTWSEMQTLPLLPMPKYISNEVFWNLFAVLRGWLTYLCCIMGQPFFKGLKSRSNFSFSHWQLCQPRVLLLLVWSSHNSIAESMWLQLECVTVWGGYRVKWQPSGISRHVVMNVGAWAGYYSLPCPKCSVVSVRLDSTEWRVIHIILNLGHDQVQVRNFCTSCFCGLSSASCATVLAAQQRVEGARTATGANYFFCLQTSCPGLLDASSPW